MPSADSATLPPLYQNRLLNRLALFCLGGLIKRIGEHYRRWCENLEQHSHALEQGTRITVERYQREINELRQFHGNLDSALREARAEAKEANLNHQQQAERLLILEEEREQERRHLTALMEQSARMEYTLLETNGQMASLRQRLDEQQSLIRESEREINEQRCKNRELLTLIDTFRQERAEAVEQCDQRDRHWRVELASLRRQLQQRDMELAGLRATLQRQETLFKQRATPSTSISIPLPIMRRLLQLCHPDKHNGSEASQEATLWLTSQKQQHRQAVH